MKEVGIEAGSPEDALGGSDESLDLFELDRQPDKVLVPVSQRVNPLAGAPRRSEQGNGRGLTVGFAEELIASFCRPREQQRTNLRIASRKVAGAHTITSRSCACRRTSATEIPQRAAYSSIGMIAASRPVSAAEAGATSAGA